MKFIKFTCTNGLPKYNGIMYQIVPNFVGDEELDEMAYEFANEYEAQFEHLAETMKKKDKSYNSRESAILDYWDNVKGFYEEIEKDEWLQECDWSKEKIEKELKICCIEDRM